MKHWTLEETEIAQRLLDSQASDAECIAAVGRKRHACYMRLNRERYSPRLIMTKGPPVKAPDASLQDAERRAKAPRTLTAWLCGDPPPGFSALDQREQLA